VEYLFLALFGFIYSAHTLEDMFRQGRLITTMENLKLNKKIKHND
jgi:hypothetical protein